MNKAINSFLNFVPNEICLNAQSFQTTVLFG